MSMKYRCQIYWWKFQTALQGNFELYKITIHGKFLHMAKQSLKNLLFEISTSHSHKETSVM